MTNPNFKFIALAQDADRVALKATEIAALFHEAEKDGINVYREETIRRNCNTIEQGIKWIREELQPKYEKGK